MGTYTDPVTMQKKWNAIEISSDLKIVLPASWQVLSDIYTMTISTDFMFFTCEGIIMKAEWQGFKNTNTVHTKITFHPLKGSLEAAKQQKDPIAAYNAAMGIIGRKF